MTVSLWDWSPEEVVNPPENDVPPQTLATPAPDRSRLYTIQIAAVTTQAKADRVISMLKRNKIEGVYLRKQDRKSGASGTKSVWAGSSPRKKPLHLRKVWLRANWSGIIFLYLIRGPVRKSPRECPQVSDSLSLDTSNMDGLVTPEEMKALQPEATRIHNQMEAGQGEGHEFLGWLHTLSTLDTSELERIEVTARQIRDSADVLVCVGIGGSYLGTRAALGFCGSSIPHLHEKPQIHFAGHNISSDYMCDLLDVLEGKSVYLNVISKSGTTTEPAIAFRLLKDWLDKTYGEEAARKRIVVTTDQQKERSTHWLWKRAIPRL